MTVDSLNGFQKVKAFVLSKNWTRITLFALRLLVALYLLDSSVTTLVDFYLSYSREGMAEYATFAYYLANPFSGTLSIEAISDINLAIIIFDLCLGISLLTGKMLRYFAFIAAMRLSLWNFGVYFGYGFDFSYPLVLIGSVFWNWGFATLSVFFLAVRGKGLQPITGIANYTSLIPRLLITLFLLLIAWDNVPTFLFWLEGEKIPAFWDFHYLVIVTVTSFVLGFAILFGLALRYTTLLALFIPVGLEVSRGIYQRLLIYPENGFSFEIVIFNLLIFTMTAILVTYDIVPFSVDSYLAQRKITKAELSVQN